MQVKTRADELVALAAAKKVVQSIAFVQVPQQDETIVNHSGPQGPAIRARIANLFFRFESRTRFAIRVRIGEVS